MNDTNKSSFELILRRLQETFPYAAPTTSTTAWLTTVGGLLFLGLAAFLFTLLRRGSDKWYNPIVRLVFGASTQSNTLSALVAGTLRAMLFVFPAICIALARSVNGVILWWVLVIGMTFLAMLITLVGYLRDSQSAKAWILLLIPLRVCVYLTLAGAFMLPAIQYWEDSEKRSRVLILIDISPSITSVSDDLPTASRKPQTRLEKMLDVLTDQNIDLIARLTEKNPVFVYRFGSRLDDEATAFTKEANSGGWTKDEWKAWANYDFRRYATQGLSPAAIVSLQTGSAWKASEPGNADWANAWINATDAIPGDFPPAELATAKSNRDRLAKRVDTARDLVKGTNVADSVLNAINRESSNMVQGLIVFSDGRSNMGSESAYATLVDAASKNKIPVFTIAVGEPRENISITITDLQAPDRATPDEPFRVNVGVDGVGLAGQSTKVKLKLYKPGNDPRKGGLPDFVLPDSLKEIPSGEKAKNTGDVTFQPGDPPTGQVEFEIDPDTLPAELLEEKREKPAEGKKGEAATPGAPTGKRQMQTGPWTVVASVDRHPKEIFAEKEHASPPRIIQVIEKPLRVLMVASGPTREYQTMRSLLAREVDQQRAELSIYMQNEGGQIGSIVQDVPPERLLVRFPDRLDTTGRSDNPENKFYNLNSYDLLILFDPDWQEAGPDGAPRIPEQAIKNIESWVNNLGGGIIYIAGPIHTYQLARGEQRLQSLLEVLPVVPEDIVVVKGRGIPREPRRLRFTPRADFDVLKLRDDRAAVDDPTAGWENFFTGVDKADSKQLNYLKPKNGIFAFYPVKDRKASATVLAEFLDVDDKGQESARPYLVVNQPVRGRTAWIGSGEIYRIRQTEMAYYDRFWVKLGRWASANRDVRAARGRALVSKEVTAGNPIRIAGRVLNTDGKVYPPDMDIGVKMRIMQTNLTGEINEKFKFNPIPLTPKKGGTWDGYYQAVVPPGVLPAGDFRYRAVIYDFPDSGGEKFEAEFIVRQSNPELDNTRPDYQALFNGASPITDVLGSVAGKKTTLHVSDTITSEADTVEVLKSGQRPGKEKLAFKLADKDKISTIPDCIDAKLVKSRNRGATIDLWDQEVLPPNSWTEFLRSGIVSSQIQWWFPLTLLGVALGIVIMLFGPRPLMAVAIILTLGVVYCRFPFPVGIVVGIVVTLLSLEWMTRKLLRLA